MRPAKFSDSKLKLITFDFKNSGDQSKWERMMGELKGLDIGLLVNNVGTNDVLPIEKFTTQYIIEMININCLAMASLTAEVVKIM